MQNEAQSYTLSIVPPLLLLLLSLQADSYADRAQKARQALLSGNSATAVQLYRRLVQQLPEETGLHLNLALALEASSDYTAELTELQFITRRQPSLMPAWLLTGLALQKLNRPAEAIAPLKKVLTAEPANTTALLELGDAYLATADAKSANQAFQTLVKQAPELPKAWQGLGLSYLALSNREAANDAFNKLAELPDSPEVHELLAEAKQQQGNRAEAIAEWRRAVELAPRDPRLTGKLAASLLTNRDYEDAKKLLEPLVAATPGNPQWQYLLGDVLIQERRTDEALPHLEAAVRLNPHLIAAQAALGRALLQLGEPAKAIPHLKLGLLADEEAILFQLSQAYKATGQTALAAQTLTRQQELLKRKQP
jgi:predicted Zn-dependent protease